MKKWQIIVWLAFTIYLIIRLSWVNGHKETAALLARQNIYLLQWIREKHGAECVAHLEKQSLEKAIEDVRYSR